MQLQSVDAVQNHDPLVFSCVNETGREQWLGTLREELQSRSYAPQPLLRVWIPKRNGGQRPLSIPTVKDRVVQTAVVLGAIFEADLRPQQYGFRPGLDAKMAVRRAYFHITQHNRRDVVDADLSDYFTTIPHGPLMKCVTRRVSDGTVLSVLKQWLTAPVCERGSRGRLIRTTEARDRKRGTPHGGTASPLLANLNFRRFILAWYDRGYSARLDAHVVNYADDLVICCRPGNGMTALTEMRRLIERLGLKVNDRKTRLACVPEESFDFLGYTVGRFYRVLLAVNDVLNRIQHSSSLTFYRFHVFGASDFGQYSARTAQSRHILASDAFGTSQYMSNEL